MSTTAAGSVNLPAAKKELFLTVLVEGKNTGMMRWMARHEAKLEAHLRCETKRKGKKKTPTNHEAPNF
jgi:hypothetical protein